VSLRQVILAPSLTPPLSLVLLLLSTALQTASRHRLVAVARPHTEGPPGLAAFRSMVLLGTAAAILAVDFRLFPLRLAKTAAEGTSFMDLGSGSFAFAHGLVSREARCSTASRSALATALRSAAPLLLLAFGRLVATRASGYSVPLDEYGRHWNFFFTLAAVRLLSALLPAPRGGGAAAAGAACCVLLATHELLLRRAGLAAFLASPHRGDDLVSQNREGLCSVVRELRQRQASCVCLLTRTQLGYWAIHLGGVATGRALFSGDARQRPKLVQARS